MEDVVHKYERRTLKSKLRDVICALPKTGLIKKPTYHPPGISFMVTLKDEERWIKLALTSILPYADEIVVVDSSVEDNSTKIVETLASQYKKIRHIRFYYDGNNSMALSCHIGMTASRFKYVFKWDADVIAGDNFGEWITRLHSLDQDLYYAIQVPRLNLSVDLNHQPKELGWNGPFYGKEVRLFTWSPDLRWVNRYDKKVVGSTEIIVGATMWGQRFPPWYKYLYWKEPYYVHCDIKSPLGRVLNYWRTNYVADSEGFLTLREYAEFHCKKDWNMTMEQSQKKLMDEYLKNTIPYNKEKYGELPAVLRAMAEVSPSDVS